MNGSCSDYEFSLYLIRIACGKESCGGVDSGSKLLRCWFQQKGRGVTLKERSASQSHFNDLCPRAWRRCNQSAGHQC
jgi:hypothetical protein